MLGAHDGRTVDLGGSPRRVVAIAILRTVR